MIILSRVGENITGSVNMKTFGIPYSLEIYNTMATLKKEADQVETMEELQGIIEQFEMLTKQDYKATVETACPDLHVNSATGKFYLKLKNGVISQRAIPQPIVDRILKSVEDKIDPQPLIKACIWMLRNPVYSDEKFRRFANYVNYKSVDGPYRDQLINEEGVSPEVATARATVFQTPITQEGLICTYKVSKELLTKFDKETGESMPRNGESTYDEETGEEIVAQAPNHVEDRVFYPVAMGLDGGDAFMCESLFGEGKLGHLIRVGNRHFLPEGMNQVDTRDDRSCVKGLHCGNLDYIRGYEGRDCETHNVFVSPMNIGAITDDGSGALRVTEYFVHSSKAGNNRGIYHSSHYASKTEDQWETLKAEAIANAEELQAELDKEVREIHAL
jgi:hypothetical protein